MNKRHYESIDFLKLLLLACVIINTFTLVSVSGMPILPMLSFASSTFFLIYGYFVLRDDEELPARLKRSIRHAAIVFVVCMVVYFALVCLSYLIVGNNISELFTRKYFFDFFVMNIWWPYLGGNIWFVQAILYALIIFYFLNKWKLLKYDLYIMIGLFVFAILVGEGAGLIRFQVLGYSYISGNFLTRTMPYMLLGRILYKARFRRDFGKIKNWMWAVIFFVGAALYLIEFYGLLSIGKLIYINHMIGFIPMAVAAAMFFLNMKYKFRFGKYYDDMGKAGFYIYSVVAQFIYLFLIYMFPETVSSLAAYLGLFTLIVTLLLSVLYARLKNRGKTTPEEGGTADEAAV